MGAIIEGLGWFGAITILGGYLLFSAGRLPNGVAYQVINLVGALAITVNVFAHHALPSTIVNGIWAIIAAVVLVRMRAARMRAASAPDRGIEPVHPEAHVELPTTTMVLPVIGPALRESGPRDAIAGDAGADRLADASVMTRADPSLQAVPVVTAAIAVALASAARDDAERRLAAQLRTGPSRTAERMSA